MKLSQEQPSQNITLHKTDEDVEVSVYKQNQKVTPENLVKQIIRIKAAFPKLPPSYFQVFQDEIFETGMSDKKLVDSVSHVIHNCEYPEPTMANFFKFDKLIKIYDYNQFIKMNDDRQGRAREFYAPIQVAWSDSVHYANKKDIAKYHLRPYKITDSIK